ncbi:hypothetical protein FA13DRAFT_1737239 [Coprinellus micaceus]|uniref:Uncharacterized protein n=1 Tax=Coprinellus micaceus TaxID=71717 RepID=A0A4Y7SXJ7_COPMI|nr:hypothetical protein FA13DRAFT_1737239 [Coprinellus micaceus]
MGIGEGLRRLEKLIERTTADLLNFSAELLANDFSFADVRKGQSICSNERGGPDVVVQATFGPHAHDGSRASCTHQSA